MSIAEYCNRSYNSASTSNVHDVIFSVHFSSSTGDVHLPSSLNTDDRQRLDADFHAADDDDVSPYATFTEVQQLQAAAAGMDGRGADTGSTDRGERPQDNGVERRRTRPGRGNAHHRRGEAPPPAGHQTESTDNVDLHALYAQPHKLISPKDRSSSATVGNENLAQSQQLFSTA